MKSNDIEITGEKMGEFFFLNDQQEEQQYGAASNSKKASELTQQILDSKKGEKVRFLNNNDAFAEQQQV